MEVIVEDTVNQYETLFLTEDKENFFRYTMMKPFEKMWQMMGAPLKAKEENGYDVLMATQMMEV
ncbi:hypothetical protein [Vagococcus carniphilus]|uniref:hypothetical protein n=1 Tax=Vagococcus carniphilus TaxID=218144 RepID=UPI003BAB191D